MNKKLIDVTYFQALFFNLGLNGINISIILLPHFVVVSKNTAQRYKK